jgi:hypothetical protein
MTASDKEMKELRTMAVKMEKQLRQEQERANSLQEGLDAAKDEIRLVADRCRIADTWDSSEHSQCFLHL